MSQLGQYVVLEKIGQGGMATVYKGMQTSLNRPVAIKVLSHQLTSNKEALERFNRESLIIARLTHPNIINVIDRGTTKKGLPYFIMNYVAGETLDHSIKKGLYQNDTNKKLNIIIQMCKALSYAHNNGVIHRDIKPSNILIDLQGNVLVSDFGVAMLYDEKQDPEEITQDGVIIGTPAYMAPEQKRGSKYVTILSDLYSVGVILYFMFTGIKPASGFKRPSEMNPDISKQLEKIILKCLEEEPANRYKSVDELKESLLDFLQGGHLQAARKKEALQEITNLEDHFVLLDIIRENQYGAVYLFQKKETKELLVVKKCRRTKGGIAEAKLLTTLRHKNIVDVFGVSENDRVYIIVEGYINGGNLKERLVKTIPWQEALKIVLEICDGLSFAHKNRIIHGNVRPTNILFSDSGEVKISDFGLEEHYSREETLINWYGIPNEPKSPQTDIFAIGIILYEMLSGSLPVWHGDKLSFHEELKFLPLDLKNIISKMISNDRVKRYRSFEEIAPIIKELLPDPESPPVQTDSSKNDKSEKTILGFMKKLFSN
ncbi:MAG: serine/threonine protein kinase [Nitrospirae bacterium]|nr:serine/threonine protein kinase [Nitrospirota bacterium]MBI3352058.1 serine/threonine protein kinase [Nitrospirota bacterium]